MNLKTVVHDWRRDILSEGLNITNPSIITEAFYDENALEKAKEVVAMEVMKEVSDFQYFKTINNLPILEYMTYTMENTPRYMIPEPIQEGRMAGVATYIFNRGKRKEMNHAARLNIEHWQRIGKNAFMEGRFKDIERSLNKWCDECRTTDEIDIMIKNRQTAIADCDNMLQDMKNGRKFNFTERDLIAYKNWLTTTHYKALLKKRKQLEEKENKKKLDAVVDVRVGNPVVGVDFKLSIPHKKKTMEASDILLENIFDNFKQVPEKFTLPLPKKGYVEIRFINEKEALAVVEIAKQEIDKTPRLKKSVIFLTKFNTATYLGKYGDGKKTGNYCIGEGNTNKGYAALNERENLIMADFRLFEKNVTIAIKKKKLKGVMFHIVGDSKKFALIVDGGQPVKRGESPAAVLSSTILNTLAESGFNPNQRNLNEITPFDGRSFSIEPWSNAEREIGKILCDICEAETDEEINEAFMNFTALSLAIQETYTLADMEDVEESIGSKARDVSRGVRNTTRKVGRKIDRTAKGVKVGVKKATDPVVTLIEKNIEKIRDADASERREIVLKGGLLPKAMRWLKRSILLVIGGTVGAHVPFVAFATVVGFIATICTDKYLDKKQRTDILKQLEDEIELVNEKLDDARGDTNRQKKYELMRIRNKLVRTRDKIKYNLKTNPEEDVVKNIKNKKSNVK